MTYKNIEMKDIGKICIFEFVYSNNRTRSIHSNEYMDVAKITMVLEKLLYSEISVRFHFMER